MRIPSWWPTGKAKPRALRPSEISLDAVKPAPIDHTLDSAAQDTSQRIFEKAAEIRTLSNEIVEMTTGLLKQFEAKNEPNGK